MNRNKTNFHENEMSELRFKLTLLNGRHQYSAKVFFLIENHRRPSMNRRPIQGVHDRGMGVHAHSAPV